LKKSAVVKKIARTLPRSHSKSHALLVHAAIQKRDAFLFHAANKRTGLDEQAIRNNERRVGKAKDPKRGTSGLEILREGSLFPPEHRSLDLLDTFGSSQKYQ